MSVVLVMKILLCTGYPEIVPHSDFLPVNLTFATVINSISNLYGHLLTEMAIFNNPLLQYDPM